MENGNSRNVKTTGMIYAGMSFGLWGILPIYWKLLKAVSALEILANRIFWSFIFVGFLMFFFKQWGKFIEIVKNKRNIKLVLLCSIMISINWFLYIWAVINGKILDTSLGYYINPLLAVFLGVTILKEKINRLQIVSLILASLGVVLVTLQYGKFPWISISLALSFALYGLFKKMLTVDSMTGLTLETAILMPAALIYILYREFSGIGALGLNSIPTTLLLMGGGIVTATPLLWFAKSTKLIDLSTVGFMQYISPTFGFFLGIFLYKESFTPVHLISFGFIWSALIIFTISNYKTIKGLEVNLTNE